ncbi:MAG: hypothetical protein JJE18_07465 [Eubacteriaceae bacterium]|nr:hypothetical protein [Eubacteriaceae bacterium]
MLKKSFPIYIIFIVLILLFTGCDQEATGTTTYITLMSVPTEATIPDGLRLDSILNITNTDPETPDAVPLTTQLGIFGYTNKDGEVEYYVYGKKQSVLNEQIHLIEEGFYAVDFSRKDQVINLSLKDLNPPITKIDLGKGIPTNFTGTLPLSFYTPTEQLGVYNFSDASGNTMLRVYSTFLGNNGNFFPASEDGTMIPGSLPVDVILEEKLQTEGSSEASRILTTPINCANIKISYEV